MEGLKEILKFPPVLRQIEYDSGRPVIVTVNTSPIVIAWAVGQDDTNGRPFQSLLLLLLNLGKILNPSSCTTCSIFGASPPIFSTITTQISAPFFSTICSTSFFTSVWFNPRKRPCITGTKFSSEAYLHYMRPPLWSPSDV
jgi:hypothetical protein